MYSLITERGKYLRVRKGVGKEDVIAVFSVPADGLFQGKIIMIGEPKRFCYARVGDTYASIARRERVDEKKLRDINSDAAVYPTLRVWLP